MVENGKLDRAMRVIDKADRLCSRSAPETWSVAVETLVMLGRFAEARQLAKQIVVANEASSDAKFAAQAAIELSTDPPPSPSISSLLEASEKARASRNYAQLQRLHDRTLWEMIRKSGRSPVIDIGGEPSNTVAWSHDGKWLAFGHGRTITVTDAAACNEQFILEGHEDTVESLAFSPDGQLASGARDGCVRLWEVPSGRLLRSLCLPSLQNATIVLAYSPGGHVLAIGAADGSTHLWDWRRSAWRGTLRGHNGEVGAITFSHDAKHLLTGSSDRSAMLWDGETGRALRTFDGHDAAVSSVAFSPDGKYVATASAEGTVRVWDARTGAGRMTSTQNKGAVRALKFSWDGTQLVSGGRDGTILRWNMSTGKATALVHDPDEALAFAWAPDGRQLAAVGPRSLRTWDTETGKHQYCVNEYNDRIRRIAFYPKGLQFATGGSTVRFWDLVQRQFVTADPEGVDAIAFTRRETHIIGMRTSEGQVILMEPQHVDITRVGGQVTSKVYFASSKSVDLQDALGQRASGLASATTSADGTHIAAIDRDGRIVVWDAQTGRQRAMLQERDVWSEPVALTKDGAVLGVATSGRTNRQGPRIRLWNVHKHTLIHELSGSAYRVTSLAFSPDGRVLASGLATGSVVLWSSESGTILLDVPGHSRDVIALAFSPDGKMLASGAQDATVRLIDTQNGKLLRTFGSHVHALSFANQGSLLATVEQDGAVRLYRTTDGERIAMLGALRVFSGGYVVDAESRIEFVGPEACVVQHYPHLVCRFGNHAVPFDVCRERLFVQGMLPALLAGDTSYAEPELEHARLECPPVASRPLDLDSLDLPSTGTTP
ncbi:WD40 repeat domain-containing protein [Polyangium sp. 15x6]|uniref:WD40 repeat domain-containing protein n=1 Tax=Polyangium sp. 15x6 TaxID=3042687 RepID=UPI00249AF6A7|nr:WD40 repeat domain-containing protein [Polyangium sp. 15x6]MDI3290722.1 WD40 repeat domain-containing protein [Polyangium sp. 15x6]